MVPVRGTLEGDFGVRLDGSRNTLVVKLLAPPFETNLVHQRHGGQIAARSCFTKNEVRAAVRALTGRADLKEWQQAIAGHSRESWESWVGRHHAYQRGIARGARILIEPGTMSAEFMPDVKPVWFDLNGPEAPEMVE